MNSTVLIAALFLGYAIIDKLIYWRAYRKIIQDFVDIGKTIGESVIGLGND